jgi:hypothetical protein
LDAASATAATRTAITDLGGRFMTSPELVEQEKLVGLRPASLYFRGRSAVLGDPPHSVVASLYGIFPTKLVTAVLARASTPGVPADIAVGAYLAACWQWGRNHLADTASPGRAAALLFALVDAADLSYLPLVEAWRRAPRPGPGDDPASLAHALMLARELRGALHFCAVRACGLTIHQAAILEPDGGPTKMRRLGWRESDIDAVTLPPDATDRRARAETLTDQATADCFLALTAPERAELADLLARPPV